MRPRLRLLSKASSDHRCRSISALASKLPFSRIETSSAQLVLPSLTDSDVLRLNRQRNIGISAHIDSGKTTLTERILYYTGRVRDIHEVRGKDGVGAKMDSMELEREKGITIQSAATFCDWQAMLPNFDSSQKKSFAINIIDTPGHVDFTIEVERALRVLDGAVLVLCAVSGVQSQTITVDRQMKRYNVPRLSFINKMDRPGANPWRIITQIREKLRMSAAAVQIPIGTEDDFNGVVDLVSWKAFYNEGVKGTTVVECTIPRELEVVAKEKRAELIEALADVDEPLAELYLTDSPISNIDLNAAIRRATVACTFSPVFLGSAIKNTAIQPLLDGVCAYLPDPNECLVKAYDTSIVGEDGEPMEVTLVPAANAPLVALAFKLEESKFGQLTYIRVYQGTLRKGSFVVHARTGKKVKLSRLVRMHSEEMEEVNEIGSGEICAIFGVDCASGDTFTDGSTNFTMTSMFVPDPVISLSIKPKGQETPNFARALNKFQREDPTFRVHIDSESKETIISGMGELHLEIYVERLRREYGVDCLTGRPRVAFRETVTQLADFNYTHKKQTGGAGQFGRVIGYIEPLVVNSEAKNDGDPTKASGPPNKKVSRTDTAFENRVMSGNIPNAYIPGVEKGFFEAIQKGSLSGHPITNVKFVLEDGAFHTVDSSELAFRLAAIGAFRDAYKKAKPVILEPIMTVEVVAPAEFQSSVLGGLNQRRGVILNTEVRQDDFTITAEVPLNEMFGYSGQLRGATQGKGEFAMEYKTHAAVLPNIQSEMEEEYRKALGIKK